MKKLVAVSILKPDGSIRRYTTTANELFDAQDGWELIKPFLPQKLVKDVEMELAKAGVLTGVTSARGKAKAQLKKDEDMDGEVFSIVTIDNVDIG